jgi:hypothetical protein
MVLVDWLFRVGDKIGILHVVRTDKPAAAAEKIQTRTVRLTDLAAEIQADQVRSLARLPDELSVRFDEVFQAAGIKPAEGAWTIENLRDLLRGEPYKSMDRETAQKALLAVLADKKVVSEDLVKDAVTRDKALDAFEEAARGKMAARREARQARLAEIQSQMDDLQKQRDQLQQEQAADQRHWRQWHDSKIDFEKEMAWAIGYLLDRPVITVDLPDTEE